MSIQQTDWGEIRWLSDEKERSSVRGLKVGIVSLPPKAHQPKHMHYEEQVIFVIQGHAVSWIDGEESHLSAGDFLHWGVGVMHEIRNTGNVPFQHLLISNPGIDVLEQANSMDSAEILDDVPPELLYEAVSAVRTQFLESMHYGYVIFDKMGNVVLQSHSYPDYCIRCCKPSENIGGCSCMNHLLPQDWEKEQTFHCRNGMEVFHYPIYFKGNFMGFIQGGYIRHTNGMDENLKEVYDVPESVIAGIRALISRVVKAIRNFCEFEYFRRSLVEKELTIVSQEENQRILMKNLRDTQYAMTDLKINNHFLFNTLNSMASMALDGGMLPLYQSIVDLSKMFHYTLRTQSSVVSLEKELDYVKAYLQLQKLRYQEDLSVCMEIDREVLHVQVPFNFLQPIVENAFVHGFNGSSEKKIKLVVKRVEKGIGVYVINSGKRLNPRECMVINQGIIGNTAHGLAMIHHKLQVFYEEGCVFEIGVEENGDTCFRIEFPYSMKERKKE